MSPRWTSKRLLCFLLVIWLTAFAIATPRIADAGGIVTREGDYPGVERLRVLYIVDEVQQRTSATFYLTYVEQDQRDFAVILPLPARPEQVDLGYDAIVELYPWYSAYSSIFERAFELPTIQVTTEPPSSCHALLGYGIGSCPDAFGNVTSLAEEGSAYELFTRASDVMQWIEEKEYHPAPETERILSDYEAQHMVFLTLQAQAWAAYDWTLNMSMLYPGTQVILPIQLLAGSTKGTVNIEAAVLASQPYTIANYTQITPDYSHISHASPLDRDTYYYRDKCALGYPNPWPLAQEYTQKLQVEHNGLAFVPEYRGSSEILLQRQYSEEAYATAQETANHYPYLTLLYLQMDGSQMTVDPVFVPDPDAAEVSNVIDLSDYDVNPMLYWRCASPILPAADANETQLPESHSYISTWGKDVFHPDNWVLSELPVSMIGTDCSDEIQERGCDQIETSLEILAPRTVTLDTLQAALTGQTEVFPMMVFTWHFRDKTLQDILGIDAVADPSPVQLNERRYLPFTTLVREDWSVVPEDYCTDYCTWNDEGGIDELYLLTTPEDWKANQALYQAIVRDALSYDYYLDPALRNVAFITSKYVGADDHVEGLISVGYPEGWQIYTTYDYTRLYWIVPEGNKRDDPGPRMLIMGWDYLSDIIPVEKAQVSRVYANRDVLAVVLLEWYGLQNEADRSYLADWWSWACGRELTGYVPQLIPFQKEGRRGYFALYAENVIEVSTPSDEFAQYEGLLRLMVEKMEFRNYCG